VNRRRILSSLFLVAALGGCGGSSASPSTTSRPAATTPSSTTTVTTPPGTTIPAPSTIVPAATTAAPPAPATTKPNGCAVASQAPPTGSISTTFATALAFAPDGRLFFTERAGTVRVFQGGQSKVFATVATVTSESGGGYSERGLLGLAIDPNFRQNRFVYAFYSDPNYTQQRVIRWTDCAGGGTQAKILVTLPSGADCCHKGGRLAFGPDGKLYVTLGDEHANGGTVAQVTSDVRGKVLRFNSDGSIPADNPFPGSAVWVYGLRNPFGLAIAPNGLLAITSNGPSGEIAGGPATGYDTVVFGAARKAGYQWPNCYGYSHPNPGVSSCGAGLLAPDWSSENSTVVPTGVTFVDGSGPAGYANRLVVCTYSSGMLIFTPGSPHGTPAPGPGSCRLDVKQGPDHALYVSSGDTISRIG
jgi:glucose/arabinose dehydrogenase